MVLTVHHLQVSQSDRIVWLCEELGIPYDLKLYQRAPLLSPPEYTALHPIGAAPVITDDGDGDVTITLAESEACVEYIINIHGGGRLTVKPGEKGYAEYLYWLHFANGTLQPAIGRAFTLQLAGIPADNETRKRFEAKNAQCLALIDKRLGETGAWLAGERFTAADVMMVFSFTTMRKFFAYDLGIYENILGYLQRVAKREGYQRAMKKGDPEMDVQELLTGEGPELFGPLKAMRG